MRAKKYDIRIRENRLPYLVMVGQTRITDGETYQTPKKIADLIRKIYHVERAAEEHVYMVAFDLHFHLVGLFEISHGTSYESAVDPAQIIQRAMLIGSQNICIIHNHPSGDPEPSADDGRFTKRLKAATDICGIRLIDHLVVAGTCKNKFYSYRENTDLLG